MEPEGSLHCSQEPNFPRPCITFVKDIIKMDLTGTG